MKFSTRHFASAVKKDFYYILSVVAMLLPGVAFADGFEDYDPNAGAETGLTSYESMILEINPDESEAIIAELEEKGVIVLRQRDELLLAFVPVLEAAHLFDKPRIKGFTRRLPNRPPNQPTMLNARQWYDAYKIYTGEGLPMPYDGTGVVVGFCDVGFDARHVNFRTADGSKSRIGKVVHYTESLGKREEFTNEEDIYNWWTDTNQNYHATHVCGIMAGAYAAEGYQGMAPGAEIVATTSQLSDVGILAGVEDIIEYAKQQGKPAVVNISIGSYLGPHDGTSLFCRYLDKCGEDAIICVSSGNEGAKNNGLSMDFTESNTTLPMQFASYTNANFNVLGYVDVWMSDAQPPKIQLEIYNSNNDAVVATFPEVDFAETPTWTLTSTSGTSTETTCHSEDFANIYTGHVRMSGEVDPVNNRYHIEIYLDAETSIKAGTNPWALYLLGGNLYGQPGQRADLYSDGSYCGFGEFIKKTPKPGSYNSINNMATGHNIVSVGMYTSSDPVLLYNGSHWTAGTPGTVFNMSGYGTLVDGRVTPTTVAPGSPIVSSCSSAYLKENPSMLWMCVFDNDGSFDFLENGISGQSDGVDDGDYTPTPPVYVGNETTTTLPDYDPTKYYWSANGGTSMSTPYVAGAIATWLQANPDLKIADVQGLLAKTNDTEGTSALSYDPRNGEGFFRPYHALQEVLANTETGVYSPGKEAKVVVAGKTLYIFNPTGGDTNIDIVGLDGIIAKSSAMNGVSTTVNMQDVPSGLYIVTVGNGANRTVKKILI